MNENGEEVLDIYSAEVQMQFDCSEEESKNNDKLLLEYKNVTHYSSGINFEDLSSNEKELYERLKKYRTIIYSLTKKKNKSFKAYNVCMDKDLAVLAKKKPSSLSELIDLDIFTDKQIKNYGEDFHSIINDTFKKFNLY